MVVNRTIVDFFALRRSRDILIDVSRKRGWGFRLLALAIGLGSLPAIEGGSRVLESASGRPANELFYSELFERSGVMMVTAEDRRGFFLVQEFPAAKPRNTTRVFIVGGSAAQGFPYQGEFGLAELLRAGLPVARGGHGFEVINAAGFGYNSARAAAVAEEVLDYQPDALIVMTGNNEFLEKRAGGAWELAAGRLLIGLSRRLRGRQDMVRWEEHEVDADERARVEAGLEAALRRVAERARQRGVKLVLVTCPTNVVGFRPNGPGAVPAEDRKKIDGLLQVEGSRGKAAELLAEQERKFPTDAWTSYMQGWLVWMQSSDLAAALALWTRARDRDSRPVRATTGINEIVRRTATTSGATLVDADRVFSGRASVADGGNDQFLDHCHPAYPGQMALAMAVLKGLAETGIIPVPEADRAAEIHRRWMDVYTAFPVERRAEFFYRAAFESGVNMKRPCRGMRLAAEALLIDPRHEKSVKLHERLRPAAEAGCLTGD